MHVIIERELLKDMPDEEPLFILRGQDKFAPLVVEFWAKLAEQFDVRSGKVMGARDIARDMERWPERKVPD